MRKQHLSNFVYKNWDVLLVALGIGLFVVFFSYQAILRHASLQSMGYDLGVYDQSIWNSSHGRWFEFSLWKGHENWLKPPGSTLGQHVEPVLLLITPLYRLWNDVRVLLFLQALVVGLGAAGIWLLARHTFTLLTDTLWGTLAALGMTMSFLLNPSIQALTLDDFHSVSLAAGLIPFAVYFMVRRRYKSFILIGLLLIFLKEDMAILVASMGLYILIVHGIRNNHRQGILIGTMVFMAGLLWAYVALVVIIPKFTVAGETGHLWRYQHILGDGDLTWRKLPGIFVRLIQSLTRRETIAYGVKLLFPSGFLALVEWPVLLIAAFPFVMNTTSAFGLQQLVIVHYTAPIVPVIYVASIMGMKRIVQFFYRRRTFRSDKMIFYVMLWSLLFTIIAQYDYGFTPLSRTFQWKTLTDHHQWAEYFFQQVPPAASVSTQQMLAPHLTHRREITLLPYDQSGEYYLVDILHNWPRDDLEGHRWLKKSVVENPGYGIIDGADGFILLRKGAPTQKLPTAFYSVFIVDDPKPQYTLDATFGQSIRLLGFDVIPHDQIHPTFTLYFQAIKPLEKDYFMSLYWADETYQVKGATEDPQIPFVWFPTHYWPEGKTIRLDFQNIPRGDEITEMWSIALGIMEQSDVWSIKDRLFPTITYSDQYGRLLSEESLVYLMKFQHHGNRIVPNPDRILTTLPKTAESLSTPFGKDIVLEGYTVEQVFPHKLSLTLYWRALGAIDTDYTVFSQLLGPDGQMWGQHDSQPGYGTLATSRWQSGVLIPDPHTIDIPTDLPPGKYQLLVGLYDRSTGMRLPRADSNLDFVGIPVTLK